MDLDCLSERKTATRTTEPGKSELPAAATPNGLTEYSGRGAGFTALHFVSRGHSWRFAVVRVGTVRRAGEDRPGCRRGGDRTGTVPALLANARLAPTRIPVP